MRPEPAFTWEPEPPVFPEVHEIPVQAESQPQVAVEVIDSSDVQADRVVDAKKPDDDDFQEAVTHVSGDTGDAAGQEPDAVPAPRPFGQPKITFTVPVFQSGADAFSEYCEDHEPRYFPFTIWCLGSLALLGLVGYLNMSWLHFMPDIAMFFICILLFGISMSFAYWKQSEYEAEFAREFQAWLEARRHEDGE